MTQVFKIFGSEMSPYSVKVRSWFRYKNIPHVWIARGPENEAEYRKVAKLPIVPTVVTPDGAGLQDSTPIIDLLEPQFAEPSIHPPTVELQFLSALVEEFGDEWGNKLMFHHRWYAELDAQASALTLARLGLPDGSPQEVAERAQAVLERMSGRGHFVGSSDATAPLITRYFVELLAILESHLARRRYLFGARPAFGDFGLAAQLYEASIDPTCGSIIRGSQNVLDWCYRMLEPRDDGPFEDWDTLKPTLLPLLEYIGSYFLPWSAANAAALGASNPEFTVELPGGAYSQPPQKYHAKSLAVLKNRYLEIEDKSSLDPILAQTGCKDVLASPLN